MPFQRGDHVRHPGLGVALWFVGHPPAIYVDDEDGPYTDGIDPDTAIVRMVGDDRDFELPTDELVALDREAFCGECGQIGCGHGT